jgi:hypothetical protein
LSAGQWDRLAKVRFLTQAILPIGLAQQDGGWRVTVGDTLDIHGYECTFNHSLCLGFLFCYMGTASRFTIAEFLFC